MQLGASFSHRHCIALGLEVDSTLQAMCDLKPSWIRLSCYWDEIESHQTDYNFDTMDHLLNICAKNQIKVLLNLGIKAQRWPEYHLPRWINPPTKNTSQAITPDINYYPYMMEYLTQCVGHFKSYDYIKIWQVENEPMDPSGPDQWYITKELLNKEIALVKKLDPSRPILCNFWGNELSKRHFYSQIINKVEIVGLDLYPRVPNPKPISSLKPYSGPQDTPNEIKTIINLIINTGSQVWITELQMEPWETDGEITQKLSPPSFLPHHISQNLAYAAKLNPAVTLVWGLEWCYARSLQSQPHYWQHITSIFSKYTLS